jgi:hypothetical protein
MENCIYKMSDHAFEGENFHSSVIIDGFLEDILTVFEGYFIGFLVDLAALDLLLLDYLPMLFISSDSELKS